jgi:hypothetical protein
LGMNARGLGRRAADARRRPAPAPCALARFDGQQRRDQHQRDAGDQARH